MVIAVCNRCSPSAGCGRSASAAMVRSAKRRASMTPETSSHSTGKLSSRVRAARERRNSVATSTSAAQSPGGRMRSRSSSRSTTARSGAGR